MWLYLKEVISILWGKKYGIFILKNIFMVFFILVINEMICLSCLLFLDIWDIIEFKLFYVMLMES